jgi:uncharacterized glyoxalase superfamily protein PhnB
MSRGQSVFPSLAYEDAERAVEWLAGTFGFEMILSVPGDGGGMLHAELRTPEGDIVMVLSTQQSTRRSRSPRSLGGTAQSVYIASSDVDGLHQRAADAGAEVFNPCMTPATAVSSAASIPRVTSGPSARTDRRRNTTSHSRPAIGCGE